MKRTRDGLRRKRAHTDASLGAERASADEPSLHAVARAQRINDDLIEHGRILADERLMKFRSHADNALMRERAPFAPLVERRKLDEETRAERAVADILLARERRRADAALETSRHEAETRHDEVDKRRADTNENLLTERGDTDLVVNNLEDTRTALALTEALAPRRAEILAIVMHDLRSPLCVIALDAQTIIETSNVEPIREMASDIRLAASRMERLLADLLDVARIESGELRIVTQMSDVRPLLVDLQRSYGPLCAEHELTFIVGFPPLSVVALFDYDRIVQVFSNLLSNAMKFTPAGATIRLDVEPNAREVEFVLRDEGSGIAPEAIPHVFEQFWQIDGSARRGLGLGLYICEKLVSAHNGRIWVESVLGQGATFHFTLPLAQEAT